MAEQDNGLSWAYFPPNTSFKLCNVTWDMSYRDIVRFADHAAQDDYFNKWFKESPLMRAGLNKIKDNIK